MIQIKDALYVDMTKIYFGRDVKINQYISIHSPSVKDVIDYGDIAYYSMINTLTAIPSDLKSQLFDKGIDYEEISDFELFYLLSRNLTPEQTGIILKDIDLSKMVMCKNKNNDKLSMVDFNNGCQLDELAYLRIVNCLRTMHSITPKIEKAANKTTKRILIELDREKIEKQKNEPQEPILLPLVSAMMRYPGFKYKSFELENISLYEFMDTVKGSQIYVNSVALLQGSYSGMIDTSKINKKEFNWARGIDE